MKEKLKHNDNLILWGLVFILGIITCIPLLNYNVSNVDDFAYRIMARSVFEGVSLKALLHDMFLYQGRFTQLLTGWSFLLAFSPDLVFAPTDSRRAYHCGLLVDNTVGKALDRQRKNSPCHCVVHLFHVRIDHQIQRQHRLSFYFFFLFYAVAHLVDMADTLSGQTAIQMVDALCHNDVFGLAIL